MIKKKMEHGSDIGDNGDYYLNTNNGEMYGPKDDNGWGNPIMVLMGDDGQDGADGSQIYSGTGATGSSLGKVGDYYLDKASYELYGPKTSSGWGTPINLKGAEGNANVTRYIYPAIDLNQQSYAPLKITGLSLTEMKNSAWEVYVVIKGSNTNISGKYYSVPGSINGTMYSMDYYYDKGNNEITFNVRRDVSATGEQFDRVEIVRIEASSTNDQRKGASGTIIPEDLDTSNYQEVADYYGFGNGH